MIAFTSEQEYIINEGVKFIHKSSEQVFQIDGMPGTGKTEVINEILRRSQIPTNRIAPMAFIGQAAIVMRTRGMYNAKTIHSWLYEPIEQKVMGPDGQPLLDPIYNKPLTRLIFRPRDLYDIDLFIIDEAYTVPKWMKKDIEARSKKIIVCGDAHQLPPVEDEPAYLVDGKVHHLTQIMRQAQGSYIIALSQLILQGKEPPLGLHGNVLVIEREDLTEEMIRNSQVVICGTNRTRDYYNNYIRHEIFHKQTQLPLLGDRVMCRKNDWTVEVDGINLTNGLTGTVTKPADVYRFDKKTYTIDMRSDLLGLNFRNIRCNYKFLNAKGNEEKNFIKNSKYSIGQMFEYAYAKTTHLCQGSQYYNGIYISEYLHKDIQMQLDFTAVTRFIDSMIYVIRSGKKYF